MDQTDRMESTRQSLGSGSCEHGNMSDGIYRVSEGLSASKEVLR